jgi:hypothetical protein
MEKKLKQHAIIFVVLAVFIHICTAYMEGSFNLSKDMRECEMIIFIFTQVLAHFAWFSRELIAKEMKKELNKK